MDDDEDEQVENGVPITVGIDGVFGKTNASATRRTIPPVLLLLVIKEQ